MCSILHLLHYGTGICCYAVMFWVLYHFCPFYAFNFFFFFFYFHCIFFFCLIPYWLTWIRYKQKKKKKKKNADLVWLQKVRMTEQHCWKAKKNLCTDPVFLPQQKPDQCFHVFPPLQVTDVFLHILYCHINISILFCVWIHVSFVCRGLGSFFFFFFLILISWTADPVYDDIPYIFLSNGII